MSVVYNIQAYKDLLIAVTKLTVSANIYGNRGVDKNELIIYFDETASESLYNSNSIIITQIVRLYSYSQIPVKLKFNSYKEVYTINEKQIVYNYLIRPIILRINRIASYRYDKRIFESIFNNNTPLVENKKQAQFLIKYYGVNNILSLLEPKLYACNYLLAKQKIDFENLFKEFENWFESASIFEQDLINTREIIVLNKLN